MLPYFHKAIIYDIRIRPRTLKASTANKDMQNVNLDIRILYKPFSNELNKIYANLGLDYEEKIMPTIINEVLRAVIA